MRRLADRVMTRLARTLVRVFFRRVELQSGANLPATGPVVVVANHSNGLVDGLLLIATLPRYPRFLGKSTLFRIPPLWPFLKLAGVIPVHRAVDGGAGDQNRSAFATCHTLLARDGVVALFPEGISHDELSVQPLRTGAARIALEAGVDGGAEQLVTVAVGLIYDAKARFRSQALVRIAEPVGLARWVDAYREDGAAAVRALTEDLAGRLDEVSPPYENWAQVARLSRLAQVIVRPPRGGLPADVGLGDQVQVAEQLARAERDSPDSPALRRLLFAFATYERDLQLLGLDDAQLTAEYPRRRLRLLLAWSVLKVLLAVPVASLGFVVHVIPFQLVKQLAKRPTNEGVKATVKLLGCFATFVLAYAALGYIIGTDFGAWPGLLVAVASPLSGYVAVRLNERVRRIGGVVEGYRTVKGRRAVLATVFAHRQDVVDAAGALVAAQ